MALCGYLLAGDAAKPYLDTNSDANRDMAPQYVTAIFPPGLGASCEMALPLCAPEGP